MKWKRSLWGPAQCETQSQTQSKGGVGEGGGWWGGVEPKELKLQQRGSETPADNLQILQEGSFRSRSHTLPTVTLKWPLCFQQQSKQTRKKVAAAGGRARSSCQQGALWRPIPSDWSDDLVGSQYLLRAPTAIGDPRGKRMAA